jgi:signal transduction histidine kinase
VWLAAAQSVTTVGVVWFVGNSTRRLAESNRLLAVLSGRLAREQEDRAVRAVTAERVRIARELHDVVAHHMSVISVQAGVARYVLESDPATTAASLDTITDTSHRALEEMRRLLSVLRIPPERPEDDLDSYDPAPGLDRLGELLDRVRGAGVPVDLTVRGEVRALPPGQDLCAYRVIQESLTNVIKHARPARAAVALAYHTRTFVARVTDDGRAAPARDGSGHGQGLIGMRERARVYGGTLSAAPVAGGGFEVELVLPVSEVEVSR